MPKNSSVEASTTEHSRPLAFRRDEASNDDFFGSHARVARAVASAICEDPGLSVVGLLGPWGSGKSTVVHLTGKELRTTHHMFTYDAWLHQSDPPRRSFLDQFLAFLIAEQLIVAEDWNERFDLIHKRIEDTNTSTTPHVTKGGNFLLLSLIALPFSTRFLGSDWAKEMLNLYWKDPKSWVFPLALFFTFLPILIAILLYIVSRFSKTKGQEESLFGLVVNKQIKSHTSRVTRTPEPTSIEFQELFRDLLNADRVRDVRIVLVIDNLDRVSEAEAMEMWGTIRSFFLGAIAPGSKPDAARMPTVLLPIDPQGISRLYEEKADGDGKLLRSFMDKTFDVVFHVAAPVVSDWQAYLIAALRSTFGNEIADRWGFEVSRIYARRVDDRVTPRDINRQVNSIAALWLQWRDASIPFPIIAYYAIFRETLEADLLAAISSPQFDLSDHDGWEKALAGIHFGVAQDNALQMLLGSDVARAIDDQNHDDFGKYMVIRGVDQLVIDRLERSTDSLQFSAKLARLCYDANPQPEWCDRVWTTMRRVWFNSEFDLKLDAHCAADRLFGIIFENSGDQDRKRLMAKMAMDISGWSKSHITIFNQDAEPRILSLLDAWLKSAANIDEVPTIVLRHEATYLNAAPLIKKYGRFGLVKAAQDSNQLARILAQNLRQEKADESLSEKVALILSSELNDDGKNFIFAAATQVLSTAGVEFARLKAAAHIVGVLREDIEEVKKWLSNFSEGGSLRQIAERALGHWDDGVASRLLALCIIEGADLPQAPGDGWADFMASRPSFIEQLERHIETFGGRSTDRLTHYGYSASSAPLVSKIMEIQITSGNLGIVDLDAVGRRFESYRAIVPEELFGDFLHLLHQHDGFWNMLEASDLGMISVVYSVLIMDRGTDNELRNETLRSLGRALSDRSESWWETKIGDDGELMQLARSLAAEGHHIEVDEPALSDAIQGAMSKLIKHARWEVEAERWFAAVQFLPKESRSAMMQVLADGMKSLPQNAIIDILRVGGEDFLKASGFAQDPNKAVKQIIIPLISTGDGILWMHGHNITISKWVNSAAMDTKTLLVDKVRHCQSDPSFSFGTLADELLASWGLVETNK